MVEPIRSCTNWALAVVEVSSSIAWTILKQRADVIVVNGIRGGFIENFKFKAIETDEAFLGSDPEITVFGTQHGLNAVLRKPIFRAPHGVQIL